MKFESLTIDVALKALAWRKASPESCRTTHEISEQEQKEWFNRIPNSSHKYWSIVVDREVVGMAGLTDINYVNMSAEFSLILDPLKRDQGHGRKAVDLLFNEAFNNLDLRVIYGEVYECSPAWGFWTKVMMSYPVKWVAIPDRKFWGGRYYPSHYFSVLKEQM
jgi:RimJ/RimL family protein N-acetyltransferase